MREQLENERANAEAYGNVAVAEKLDRILDRKKAAEKRAAEVEKTEAPAVRPRVNQRRSPA